MAMRASWIEIDLEQIRKNVRFLKSRTAPGAKFMGVVKGDGYGCGAIPVANILAQEGADCFAVALVQEGVELRNAGFNQPILLLGHTFVEDYPEVLQFNLTASIFTVEQAQRLNDYAASLGKKATIHVKVDTGMGRLGFLVDDADTVDNIAAICAMPNLYVEGIFSHFANSWDIADHSYPDLQFAKFNALIDKLKARGINIPIRHMANSAATIARPEYHMDLVRPGTTICGMSVGPEIDALPYMELYPAVEIKSKLAYVKPVPAGTKVSYGSLFETTKPSVLGIVPLGYVDGIFRQQCNVGSVLLHGKRCPMVGKVCMDQFVIDISEVENPQEGDEIVIVGRQGEEYISLEEIGEKSGTISIEVLCDIGKRMPIVYKGGWEPQV